MKPGDLFEWVYKSTLKSVRKNEKLYTSLMNKWVPCDGLCLCVGVNKNVVYWLSKHGLLQVIVVLDEPEIRWIDAQIASVYEHAVLPKIQS